MPKVKAKGTNKDDAMTVEVKEKKFNMMALGPFFVFTALLLIVVIVGIYKDTV